MIGEIKVDLQEQIGREIRPKFHKWIDTMLQADREMEEFNGVMKKWGISNRLHIVITFNDPVTVWGRIKGWFKGVRG